MIALDVEGRGAARRVARGTELLRYVLRAFVDRAGPVQVDEIVSAFPAQAPESVREALAKLDKEDLIRLDAGRVDLAYPFSASVTPFVLDVGQGGGERYVCCAVDALGIAPMLGRRVRIRSQCHHCAGPIELSVDPAGPRPEGEGLMVWVRKRAEDERFALKLPEETRAALLRERRAKPLRYFKGGPIKKEYVVLSAAAASEPKALRALLGESIRCVTRGLS